MALAAVCAVATLLAVAIEQRGCNALYKWLLSFGGRKSAAAADRPAERPPTNAV